MDEITENVILTREQRELLLSFAESPQGPEGLCSCLCNHANQSIPADRRSHRSNRKKVWSERDRVYTFRTISGATCL